MNQFDNCIDGKWRTYFYRQEAISEILVSANMELIEGVRTPINADCFDLSLGYENLLAVRASEV